MTAIPIPQLAERLHEREPGEDDDLGERGIEVSGIKLVRACDVADERTEWLIPNFLARSELTDLSGDPGVGKGGITASWAGAVTTGRAGPPASVILFSTEDRLGHVKARLRAEGADLARVFMFDIRDPQPTPSLPGDVEAMEELVRKTESALVVFDPALEFLASALDSHKQQDVQRFTAALSGVAHRTGAAVVTVRHLNKAQGVSAVYRGAGSIAFVARARMALLAAKDKDHGGRVLTVVKGNISGDTHSIAFDIRAQRDSTVVVWGEASTVTADELVTQDPRKRGPAPEKAEAARDFLADLLAPGPVAKQDAITRGRAAGFSRSLLYSVAKTMNLEVATVGLKSGWRLN